jgi:ElaB/YqjD/DUF883 family membrane-anchored ribosome-binding protein
MPENKINQLTNQAADIARTVKEKTQEFSQATVNKIEENRIAAAAALRNAAASIHDNASKLPDGPRIAHSTAENVDSVAGYLQTHNTKRMMMDAGAIFRKNPMPSLLIAGAVGFVIGRSFRRS